MAHNLLLATFGTPRPPHEAGDDVWLQEANHRIANNLSLVAGLLQLQAAELDTTRTVSGEDVSGLLHEAASRVQMVARLHRLLARADDDDAPDLTAFLREIAEATRSLVAPQRGVTIAFFGEGPCPMPAERTLPIGLIVGELLTNSLKYAHPAGVAGRIALVCERTSDGDLRVAVSDDGVGFPEALDPTTATTLGMRLITSLARQIGAALSFDQTGIGLTVHLTIPATVPYGSIG